MKDLSRSGQASTVIRIQGRNEQDGGSSAGGDHVGSSSPKAGQVSGLNSNDPKLSKPMRVYVNKKPVKISNPTQLHSPIEVDLEHELEHAVNQMV